MNLMLNFMTVPLNFKIMSSVFQKCNYSAYKYFRNTATIIVTQKFHKNAIDVAIGFPIIPYNYKTPNPMSREPSILSWNHNLYLGPGIPFRTFVLSISETITAV